MSSLPQRWSSDPEGQAKNALFPQKCIGEIFEWEFVPWLCKHFFKNLTLMLLVANFPITKWCRKTEKVLKPWHMGIHLRVHGETYLMNTNMPRFRWFSKNICIPVLWTKVASTLEGLIEGKCCQTCLLRPPIELVMNCLFGKVFVLLPEGVRLLCMYFFVGNHRTGLCIWVVSISRLPL